MHDPIPSSWNDDRARGLSEQELLLYRSNLLGSDLRITNFGGGNTSAKVTMQDPLTGEPVEVLWVKGSGGDLGSMGLDGFATLYLEKLEQLRAKYRGLEHEDEMVGYYPHCTFGLNPRPASIDTPLHAYVPRRHADHVHPDALIALAAAADGERLTREIFEGELGWLPWQRPGFDLGLRIGELARAHPELCGVVLGGHGLMTWADDAKECYELTLRVVNRAAAYLRKRMTGRPSPFGAPRRQALAPAERRAFAARFLPVLRGRLGVQERKVGHFDDSEDVLELVNAERAAELAGRGTSCPDHFLRTKIRPLFLHVDPAADSLEAITARLDEAVAAYREDYRAYYERCKEPNSPPMRDPSPVVVLIPGLGMITMAKDKTIARQAAEFYENAVHVMKGAMGVSDYVGLPEREAFRIEYWELEEAKLRRMPPEAAMSRRIVLVTGGAGGIGRAVARRLLREKACVVLTDLDEAALAEAEGELREEFGRDPVRSVPCDVTDERSVQDAVAHAAVEYGGLDVLVCSAGLASAAPIVDTSLELWRRNQDVLATGYFLAAREAFGVFLQQGTGGSIVFVASKNALAASPQASAYCAAKAAELHLARCLALEGGPEGIRVNSVNPDAVLQGSKIWRGSWRKERAAAYGIEESELEEHYRKRSLLQRSVLPEDIAEAVYFFASEASAKSTGNVLNVDAGNATAFPR